MERHEIRRYWKGHYFRELTDEAIDTLIERADAATSPLTQVLLIPMGGALARVPNDATALGGREAPWQFHAIGAWADGAESDRHIAWVRETADALRPWVQPGVYLNYTSDEGPERVREAYAGATWERLVQVKHRYDPTNLFHRNQNVRVEAPRP